MKKLIIDCDPGIDDALALWLAAGSRELEILAVSTVAGNRPADTTCANARRLMDLAGQQHVPVFAGAARPLGHPGTRCNLVHGEDGLGGVELGSARAPSPGVAAIRLVELLAAHPRQSVTVVALGPLTNLALADALAPGILARAHKVLIMGGALRCAGNITPEAEFNFYADPVAATMVLDSGADIVLFPLDVTGAAVMSSEWIASFGESNAACARAALAMLTAYSEFDPLLHDACPVAYAIAPELFRGRRCRVAVDWAPGGKEGHCVSDFDSATPNLLAMNEVALPSLLDLVHERIGFLP